MDDLKAWLAEQQQGPRAGRSAPTVDPTERLELTHEVPVHELPHLRRLVASRRYGPNLTHLASRTDVRRRHVRR